MTDTSNTGGRFDSAVQRARAALDALRGQLAERVDDIGQDVNTKLDEIQTAIDEIQSSWAERPQPDNTLPGQQPPQPTQLPADQVQAQSAQPGQSQGGGTTPPPQAPPGV